MNNKFEVTKINEERLENDLVIYFNNEIERNSYGTEIAVNNMGIVIDISPILLVPKGGFVVSAHGTKEEFISKIVKIGSTLTFNEKEMFVEIKTDKVKQFNYLLNLYIEKLEEKLNEVVKSKQIVDIKNALKNINHLKDIQNDNKSYKEDYVTSIYYETVDYLTVSGKIEARGVWHRPIEKNLEELTNVLDTLVDLNINDIYVETFWNGFSIYPSKVVPLHPNLDNNYGLYGNDYLKALISEAHKRNIGVHAWLENFFVGVLGTLNSSLWEDNPNWRIINYNDLEHQTGKPGNEEEGFLFFDPANDEVQAFIIEFYKELVTNYNIDGIQLDYIRYPAANENYIFSSGYTDIAISKFKEKYQFEGDIREFVKIPKQYQLWNEFRVNIITNFVEKVYKEIFKVAPNILLSIAVGPNSDYAVINLMQDWKTWVENGWIDIIAPMAYVRSRNQIKNIVIKMNEISNKRTYNYTGISPTYDKLPSYYNTMLVDESRINNALGSVIFAYHSLKNNEEVKKTLKRGIYRNRSIRPHDNINNILKKAIEIIKEYEMEFNFKFDDVIKIIYDAIINNTLEDKKQTLKQIITIDNNIESLIKKLIYIIEIKINRIKNRSVIN